MASQTAVQATLKALAANHNRSREWVSDNMPLWMKGLIHHQDAQLAQAVSEWSLKKNKAPTLHDMLTFIKGLSSFVASEAPPGCPQCDSTGWRELARHFTNDNGKKTVMTAVAPCDCSLGEVLHVKNRLPYYHEVVDRWQRAGSDKVYYSSDRLPHLLTKHRYTDEALERMKGRGPRGNVFG